MKVLVVYDSVFGNTEKVALAMGDALKVQGEVTVSGIGQMTSAQLAGVDLLIMGSPTRGFAATEPVMKFLAELPENSLKGIKAAAFDTRMDPKSIPFWFRGMVARGGYADKPIQENLKKKGAQIAAPSMGFIVKGQEGPLNEGELERAAAWARSLPLVAG